MIIKNHLILSLFLFILFSSLYQVKAESKVVVPIDVLLVSYDKESGAIYKGWKILDAEQLQQVITPRRSRVLHRQLIHSTIFLGKVSQFIRTQVIVL